MPFYITKKVLLLMVCLHIPFSAFRLSAQTYTDTQVLESALQKGALAADYWVNRSGANPSRTNYYADICSYYGACIFGDASGDSSIYEDINSEYNRTTPIDATNIDKNSCGILPLHLYLHNGKTQQLNLGLNAADANIRKNGHFRNAIDDTYMTGSLQIQAYRATDDSKYLDFCADFIIRYMESLQQNNGLYWHHGNISKQFWGRGNGWGAASTAELVQVLPENHSKYNQIVTGFKNHMKGLIDVQLESGMWPQLLASSDGSNWEETSGTSMFVFALFTGLELGILDEQTYLEPAKRGWMALAEYLSSDGRLNNIAEGFWPRSGTAGEYLNAPKASAGNSHGTAGFLWAATAIVKYYQSDPSGFRISVQTSGRGTVTRTPDMRSYTKDTTVALTATPRSGWGFTGWSGDITSEENPLTITVDTNISLTADFVRTGIDTTELVTNGRFSSESESWTLNNWGGEGSGSVVSEEYRISISAVGENAYEIQLVQPGIILVEGITYKLSFEAYTQSARTLEVTVGQHESPWDKYIDEPLLASLSETKQSFEIVFEMADPTDENTRIEFNAGDKMGDVFIDNVSLKEASATPVRIVTRKKSGGVRITSSGITFDKRWSSDVAVNMYSLAGKLVYRDVFTPAQGDKMFRWDKIHVAEGLYIAKVCSDNMTLHTELVHVR